MNFSTKTVPSPKEALASVDARSTSPLSAPASGAEAAVDAARARALAERLPPRQREALLLRLEEMPYGEIAQLMGCSEGAAKAHVHQAVGNLRKMMGAAGRTRGTP